MYSDHGTAKMKWSQAVDVYTDPPRSAAAASLLLLFTITIATTIAMVIVSRKAGEMGMTYWAVAADCC